MRAPLSWLKPRPPWIEAICGSPPFRRLTKAESRRERDALDQAYGEGSGPPGYSLIEAARAACRDRIGRAIPIGRGPTRRSRTGDVVHEALWIFDPDRPKEIWLALEPAMPPLFWIPAGATAESVKEVIAAYFSADLPARLDLPAVARGFAGTETMLEADHAQLENHFTMMSALDFLSWGSAYDDDPWPAEIPARIPREELIARLREFMAQHPSRVRSTSFRALWSRSVVTLERHGDGWFVLEARYRPARTHEVIRAYNEAIGADLPLDLPVDVAASLLGLDFTGAPALERALEDPTLSESVPFHLLALGAVRHSDLRMAQILRRYRYADSAQTRRVVAILADWLRYDLLLHELCAVETDPRLAAELERMTAFIEPGGGAASAEAAGAGDEDDGLDDEEDRLSDADDSVSDAGDAPDEEDVE